MPGVDNAYSLEGWKAYDDLVEVSEGKLRFKKLLPTSLDEA